MSRVRPSLSHIFFKRRSICSTGSFARALTLTMRRSPIPFYIADESNGKSRARCLSAGQAADSRGVG